MKSFKAFIFSLSLLLGACLFLACPLAAHAEENETEEIPIMAEDMDSQPFSGTGTEGDPYLLQSVEDLTVLREKVNTEGETFRDKTFRITADMALPADWVPIGGLKPGETDSKEGVNIMPFSGILDGDGHLVTVAEGGQPLFGYVRGAAVKNLNIYGSRIASDGIVANYVIDYGSGGEYSGDASVTVTFENVTIKKGTSTLRSGFIGGTDETVANEYSQTSSENLVHFINCTVESGVTIGYDRSRSNIGSFAGQLNGTASGCRSGADVYGVNDIGGIVGRKSTSMGDFSITNCTFTGNVTASGRNAGGIVGSGYDHYTAPNTRCAVIENCEASGSISGNENVGGILGGEPGLWQAWNNGIAYIRNNRFTGKVSGNTAVGGVIGYYRSLNCYTVIENNFYVTGCGADKGIGQVLYVDSSIYADGRPRAIGWVDGVYCFDTAEDTISRIKYDLDRQGQFNNIARTNHNRDDDPLGKDAENLCYSGEIEEPELRVAQLVITGSYKTEYTVGEALSLDGMQFTAVWSDGSETVIAPEQIAVSGFDSSATGTTTVTFRYDTASALVTMTVKPASSGITVYVTVLGDGRHDSDTDGRVHTLSGGGLSTWVGRTAVNADTADTVWDVLQRVLSANGLSPLTKNSLGTVYISGVVRGGVSLSEFDNGRNSGWMYTVNGKHPVVGVSQKYVQNGDEIVLHYTDDYTREEGSEGYNPGPDPSADAAKSVEALIDAIALPVTAQSGDSIAAARAAYDALTDSGKAKVSNYEKLKEAEKAFALLSATGEDRKNADEVSAMIDAITFPVTEDQAEKIKAAREAYDKLTDLQKQLVDNEEILKRAETVLEKEESVPSVREIYDKVGDFMEDLGNPVSGAIGGEWMVIGLVRSGRTIEDPSAYYRSALKEILDNIDENERLHSMKSTENSRMILALTSLGMDAGDIADHDLLMGLSDLDYVKKQGINGPSWALLALDSGSYEERVNPDAKDPLTRDKLIAWILQEQLEDGGWALSGNIADSDITGMVLQSLAPYVSKKPEVKKAVEKALEALSAMQNDDGSFSAFGGDEGPVPTSESTAQIIVALSALGIDAHTDLRFVKNGKSAVDALCSFYVENEGFRHIAEGPTDGMATEQGYYALTAYFRMRDGMTSLYDMTDVVKTIPKEPEIADEAETEPGEEAEPEEYAVAADSVDEQEERKMPVVPVVVLFAVAAAGIAALAVMRRKRNTAQAGNPEGNYDKEEK